jgi:hypothetical protein
MMIEDDTNIGADRGDDGLLMMTAFGDCRELGSFFASTCAVRRMGVVVMMRIRIMMMMVTTTR